MIALLVITDGRKDCIEATIASANEQLKGPITERWMYDDSGDPDHRAWLRDRFPEFLLFWRPDGRQGFAGAVREAWATISLNSAAEYVFHLEDDFTFNRPVPLEDMRAILVMRPKLAQVALRRQPWNDIERAAGGIVESRRDCYTEHTFAGLTWLEHDLFFTTNPSLYRRDLIEQFEWPPGAESEGRFSIMLREADRRFSFFGGFDDGERVTHIGEHRAGKGY